MAVTIEANGGTDEQIYLHSNQGTGVSSVYVKSDDGGVKIESGLDSAASVHLTGYGITFTGGDNNDSIYMENSPIKFEQISAPSTTTNKLYNVGGDLTWDGSAIDATKRTLFMVTGSSGINAGQFNTLTGSASGNNHLYSKLDGSDDVTWGTDTFESRGRKTEVYVNGQLLLSGSETQMVAGARDYTCLQTSDIAFGFALEYGDIVQVLLR